MRVGQRVTLKNTGNVRVPDGTAAVIVGLESWGAHVKTQATATGRYRAAWSEMVNAPDATGHVCADCGGVNLVRSGSCLCCQDCGSTSGCS